MPHAEDAGLGEWVRLQKPTMIVAPELSLQLQCRDI